MQSQDWSTETAGLTDSGGENPAQTAPTPAEGVGSVSRRELAQFLGRFEAEFGVGEGVRLFFAPGRVNLMGAHLDYNGGPVMPTAIDRGTFLALRARKDRRVRLASTLESRSVHLELGEFPAHPSRTWADYPVGVLRHMAAAQSNNTDSLMGADCLFGGNLPIGAGLSSSASICVATAFAFDAHWRLGAKPLELAKSALWSEREFVGVKCGIMDPYAVTLTRPGHLLWLDCKDESVEHLPLDSERVTIAVADSGVRRELAQGAFNDRVEECGAAFEQLRAHEPGATCLRDIRVSTLDARSSALDPLLERRARHVVTEVQRTELARTALRAGDMLEFGRQMTAAHRSLRDLFEVSIPELDRLVDTACGWEGVLGTRLTGAGFGGCIVVLMRTDKREGFRTYLQDDFEAEFGTRPNVEFFRGSMGPRELDVHRV